MAKKNNKKDKEAKKARVEEKNKKNLAKAERNTKKKAKKTGEIDEDDVDIDEILANYKKEQEAFEAINIESVERPSKRINSSMVANPNHGKKELIIFGGENTVDNISAFYNDLFTYAPDSDQWRKITSRNSPMPRSSAAIAAHPSGVILLHGGEFSSPKQNTFYHYSDTWLLDSTTKEWTKIEDKKKGPSARSGHRITIWKNFFIMSGGFRDLGSSTSYLHDLWVFDITSYKWTQIEFPPNHPIPDARSGHSLIPDADGALLWGGYCKVKAGKGLQKGKILTDCWMLKMKSDLSAIRWERRKKQGFQPSPRVGCSMVHHKGRGVLFGGVYDFEETEESLDSLFYNDLFTYQIESNRWYSLSLRAQKAKQQKINKKQNRDEDLENVLNSILEKAKLNDDDQDDEDDDEIEAELKKFDESEEEETDSEKREYPIVNSLPHPRFNASTAVVDDTLFIFGGVWEFGERDYSIDSLYSIDLAKLDGLKIYWENLKPIEHAVKEEDEDEEDEEEDDDEGEDDDEEETEDKKLVAEEEEEEEEDIIEEEPEIPDPRPWLPHPKAFESLRAFYVRSGAQFLEWAISQNKDARGKHLKKKSFDLCQDRWWERREQIRIEEDKLEELGGVDEVIEKDTTKTTKTRR
ncbi:Kelch repeat-containing protein 3 [Wickerhamomyces ciferrii]|uniref:Kelch repeat-containing protein 3 n=1 Tax=Wickerhamomyces ciferrii (strain ATCC 14091 / BCRC 22168 / CBS 111 / JCM 3599 / NBRC 0793 / NRRL Y-1031 F-60-10) TaxID=1206466 RepID=K0KCF6_WICCF|nr:Kelch repeat-containing protein 3 [Wickerhamomyces ciferrii]CCH40581.1 Kelch repeat-containing protein 3 [Wickerhamomyces ciferrii]